MLPSSKPITPAGGRSLARLGCGGHAAPALLRLSGWTIRLARGSAGRPALEVHAPTGIVDVAGAATLGAVPLRGAARGVRAGRTWALAWGQLAAGDRRVEVSFRGGGSGRRAALPMTAIVLADRFWVAEAAGDFRSVAVTAGCARAAGRLRRNL